MLDLDRSAARGMMAARRLIAFRHDSDLGNAQAHRLFERMSVTRVVDGDAVPVGDAACTTGPRRGRSRTTASTWTTRTCPTA